MVIMPPDPTAITQQKPKLLPIVHSFEQGQVSARSLGTALNLRPPISTRPAACSVRRSHSNTAMMPAIPSRRARWSRNSLPSRCRSRAQRRKRSVASANAVFDHALAYVELFFARTIEKYQASLPKWQRNTSHPWSVAGRPSGCQSSRGLSPLNALSAAKRGQCRPCPAGENLRLRECRKDPRAFE
jgi:hypothetical protein